MRQPTFKDTKLLFGLVVFSAIFIFLIYFGLKRWQIDLDTLQSFKGAVTYRGEITSPGRHQSRSFCLKLGGLEEMLGLSRSNEEYGSLINEIETGDTLTVFFEPLIAHYFGYAELMQIEKKGIIILDKDEHERFGLRFIWIGSIGIIVTLIVGFLKLREPRPNKRKKQPRPQRKR